MLNSENEYIKYKRLRRYLECIAVVLSFAIADKTVKLIVLYSEKIFSLGSLLFLTIGILPIFIFDFLITKFIKYLAKHNEQN